MMRSVFFSGMVSLTLITVGVIFLSCLCSWPRALILYKQFKQSLIASGQSPSIADRCLSSLLPVVKMPSVLNLFNIFAIEIYSADEN